MRPELVFFFIAFSLLGTQNWFILRKIYFWNTIFIEKILIWIKITLKVNKYPVFTQTFNSR